MTDKSIFFDFPDVPSSVIIQSSLFFLKKKKDFRKFNFVFHSEDFTST